MSAAVALLPIAMATAFSVLRSYESSGAYRRSGRLGLRVPFYFKLSRVEERWAGKVQTETIDRSW